ncbi:hypothetical protein SCHPADRAFT_799683, partial [Schizopora paradoxa]
SKDHAKETGRLISLNHQTLSRRVDGGRSRATVNAAKGWLHPAEVEQVIRFADEMGERAIPLTHKTLREYVNMILKARLGPSFPGVGENW